MNIRKHWKNLLLTTTALFWTSCTSESDSTFPTIGQDMQHSVDTGISSDSNIENSSENTVESSSPDAVASGSSEANSPSSSSAAESSSSGVTCHTTTYFDLNRTDRYSIEKTKTNASSQAKADFKQKIVAISDSLPESSAKCINNLRNALERNFAAAYGTLNPNPYPAEAECSDGTKRLTKEYLEQLAFEEEQAKKKPQYDSAYAEAYEKETQNLNKQIENCLKNNKQ